MSDIPPEPLPEPTARVTPTYANARAEKPFMSSGDIVSIIATVMVCLVVLCCIASCTLLGFAFLQNPPW